MVADTSSSTSDDYQSSQFEIALFPEAGLMQEGLQRTTYFEALAQVIKSNDDTIR